MSAMKQRKQKDTNTVDDSTVTTTDHRAASSSASDDDAAGGLSQHQFTNRQTSRPCTSLPDMTRAYRDVHINRVYANYPPPTDMNEPVDADD